MKTLADVGHITTPAERIVQKNLAQQELEKRLPRQFHTGDIITLDFENWHHLFYTCDHYLSMHYMTIQEYCWMQMIVPSSGMRVIETHENDGKCLVCLKIMLGHKVFFDARLFKHLT
ncbi:MAG: hypothetical protein WCG98_03470 [bacterium]